MSILSRGSAAPAAALLAATCAGAWILLQDGPAEAGTGPPSPTVEGATAGPKDADARPCPGRLSDYASPAAGLTAVEAVHRQPEAQPREAAAHTADADVGAEPLSPTAAMILKHVDSGRIGVSPGILRADLYPIAEKAVACGVHPDRLRLIRLEPPEAKAHVRLCAITGSAVGRTAWLLRHERMEWRLVGRSRW